MIAVGRDLCGSSSLPSLPKQGNLQQAAQDLVQAGLEYLQRRRLHNLPGERDAQLSLFFHQGFLAIAAFSSWGLTTAALLNFSFLEEEVFCGYWRYIPAGTMHPSEGRCPFQARSQGCSAPWQSSALARAWTMVKASGLTWDRVLYRLFQLNQDFLFCVPSPSPAPI